MSRSVRSNRFTIFDVMEAKGVFEDNPANSISPDYGGPKQYPKMFYHPTGLERVTQRAEVITTPMGPEKVGELRELVSRVANDAEEETALRAAGWHDHPSKAMKAGGREPPPVVDNNREEDLEAEIKRLQAELEIAKASPKAPPSEDEALALMR